MALFDYLRNGMSGGGGIKKNRGSIRGATGILSTKSIPEGTCTGRGSVHLLQEFNQIFFGSDADFFPETVLGRFDRFGGEV